jgi:hypothetical protein
MKKINLKYSSKAQAAMIAVVMAVFFLAASCDINDPVADISAPGYIAPNVYWDIPVTNVTAGNEVEFYAEYWSVDHSIKELGVWYDIEKNLKYILTYPPAGYTFTLDSAELSREFLEIKTFQHSADNYDPERKAFVIRDKFPVSYTLSSLEYKNPISFNAGQFNQLIPENVRSRFIKNLFPLLGYQDFRTMLITDRQVVEESVFLSYFDQVTQGEVVTYTMKAEAAPALRAHLAEVPFSAFIYNRNRQYFAVEFTQGYSLNARFRVVNGNQAANFSEAKKITVF